MLQTTSVRDQSSTSLTHGIRFLPSAPGRQLLPTACKKKMTLKTLAVLSWIQASPQVPTQCLGLLESLSLNERS
uniref:Uncharacterized protein n=1 Tax=Anguilla anguilla TaxID=7936 RepID=A0A0E9XPN3_ANGAN